jgi:hypothetical protein
LIRWVEGPLGRRAAGPWPAGLARALTALGLCAACATPGGSYRILFGGSRHGLSLADERAAFATFSDGLSVSADGARLEDPYCGDLSPSTDVVDLNADGTPEIFVLWGNACTSGLTGRSLTLLVRDRAGSYRAELGFPATAWKGLPEATNGWPDLEIGGPGFCDAVWTHRGETYEFKCNLPQAADGCADVGSVCPVLDI